MARPDPIELRRQRALHQLQRSRLQLLVAARQDDDDGPWPEPSTDWWSRLQPWLTGGLSALPLLGGVGGLVAKLFTQHAEAPMTAAAGAGEDTHAASPPASPVDQLTAAVKRHPLLSLGVAVAAGTLLWHQRRQLRHFVAGTVLPELLSTLSVQAAPHLSGWLQAWLTPDAADAATPVSALSDTPARPAPTSHAAATVHHGGV